MILKITIGGYAPLFETSPVYRGIVSFSDTINQIFAPRLSAILAKGAAYDHPYAGKSAAR